MARISATFFRATATAPLFFTLAPPRRVPPFLVRASGVVARGRGGAKSGASAQHR